MSQDANGLELSRGVGIDLVRLTEGAAVAAAAEMGRGSAARVYEAARSGFLQALGAVSLSPLVAMGDAAAEEQPFLVDGERLRTGEGMEVDLAVRLVECLTACSLGGRNAMSTVVMAPAGTIRPIPQVYMDKIAVGPAARDAVDFDLPPDELFGRVAESLGLPLTALAVVVLDRPRNQRWVEAARTAGARVRLIADGDLAAAIATAVPDSGINMLVGSGGAREGWLAAAALRGLGGQFLGRYLPFKPQDQRVLAEHGFEAKMPLRWDDLLPAEFMLSVTGISDGDALRGIRLHGSHAVSESLLLRTASETVRWIRTERRLSD